MSTESGRVRSSDTEREEYAALVREAVGEGRLSLAEGDERLAAIYATRFRDELRPLITDLPSAAKVDNDVAASGRPTWPHDRRQWHGRRWDGPPPPHAFARHLTAVVLVSAALTGLWLLSGAHFFWPAIPLIFFAFGLVRHARWRSYARRYR